MSGCEHPGMVQRRTVYVRECSVCGVDLDVEELASLRERVAELEVDAEAVTMLKREVATLRERLTDTQHRCGKNIVLAERAEDRAEQAERELDEAHDAIDLVLPWARMCSVRDAGEVARKDAAIAACEAVQDGQPSPLVEACRLALPFLHRWARVLMDPDESIEGYETECEEAIAALERVTGGRGDG